MAGAEAEGRRESEAEAEDEWASEAEGVPLTEAERGTGKAERKRIGVCGRSTEDKGVERKAKESAGEGRHQEKCIFLLLPFPTFFSFYTKKDEKGGKRIKRQ